VAPYLGVVLKNVDARLPFALASVVLLATTAGLVWLERHLAHQAAHTATSATPATPATPGTPGPNMLAPAPQPQQPPQAQTPQVLHSAHHAGWMLGILLLATAFQTHFSLNAAALYLRFVAPADLQWLMPTFWVAFGLVMLPGGALCKRFGALPVMAAAALCGAGSAVWAAQAGALPGVLAAQLGAGAAWGCMLLAVFTSAAELGRSGREGLALGTMFAMLSLAALVRIGVVLAGLPKNAAVAPLLPWLPVVLWVLGGVVVGLQAWRSRAGALPVAGPAAL
jgi:hypothetical protein